MSSIQNEGFIIYIKVFLSLALHYIVGFGQVLDTDSDEKARFQDIRTFIIISCWNIHKITNFSS